MIILSPPPLFPSVAIINYCLLPLYSHEGKRRRRRRRRRE